MHNKCLYCTVCAITGFRKGALMYLTAGVDCFIAVVVHIINHIITGIYMVTRRLVLLTCRELGNIDTVIRFWKFGIVRRSRGYGV